MLSFESQHICNYQTYNKEFIPTGSKGVLFTAVYMCSFQFMSVTGTLNYNTTIYAHKQKSVFYMEGQVK